MVIMMKIRQVINNKNEKKNYEIKLVMPRVIINDKSLLLILGEWLKIENLNESDANLEKLEETIKYDLSQIFSMAGIDKSEICILDQY